MSSQVSKKVDSAYPSSLQSLAFLFLLNLSGISQTLTPPFLLLIENSNFIFKGTVLQLDASNIDANISENERSAVVRVDEVIESVEQYAGSAGREITVVLAVNNHPVIGAQLTFYTVGWFYGGGLGVREVNNKLFNEFNPKLRIHINTARRFIREKHLDSELDLADLVVEGTVINIVEDSIQNKNFRSEHKPAFKIGKIRITKTYKGKSNSNIVSVYFASSLDLAWINSPKLRKNQKAIFLIRRGQAPVFLQKEAYSVLDYRDVQPLTQMSTIKKLINKQTKK